MLTHHPTLTTKENRFAHSDLSYERDQDLIRCLKSIFYGDYSVMPQGKDELSEAVRKVAKKLCAGAQDEMSRVVSLSVKTGETAIFSARMLSDLRHVDHQAQSIAAASEEMAASAKSIGGYSENIQAHVHEAQSAVSTGAEASSRSVAKIGRISETVCRTLEKVTGFARFSDRIEAMSGDIKTIAEQTNLLSLNAAVEAARAGDAGKGFAVVAAEVKKLAEQTKSSTAEIHHIVSQLQSETRSVLASMEECNTAVQEGQAAITDVNRQMDEIRNKFACVDENTENIVNTLNEQTGATQAIANSITEIASDTNTSIEGTENIVDAIGEIEKIIHRQISKLAELNLPDKVVKLAQSDHVLWKLRLANMVIGREGLNAEELSNHHTCRLGKWYDQVDDPKYLENPAFRSLVAPHRLVHEHGIQAVRYFNDGKLKQAIGEIEKVEAASQDVLRLLAELASE